jgi:hypothetical protein
MEKWNCGCGNESEGLPRVANGSPPSERDGAEALSLDFIKNNVSVNLTPSSQDQQAVA